MSRLRHILWTSGFLLPSLVLSACSGSQNMLNPAGPQADRISTLWWTFLYIGAAVYVIVIAVMLVGVMRARRHTHSLEPILEPEPASERRTTRIVIGAVGVTAFILIALLVVDQITGRAISDLRGTRILTVQVTGHQWWWEVTYEDPRAANMVTTANELHIPVGRPVRIRLNSTDVIHSLWIPNLHGKKDLIPGDPANTWLRADSAGTYYGQCAEFCGHQHANMRIVVIAEEPARFDQWYRAQLSPAPAPRTADQRRGQMIFLQGPCVMCHAIQGTPANATIGPNLTHVASRPWIGAGAVPNTRGHLAGWILDPQQAKPAAKMPPNPMSPDDLHALLAYMETLK